jgi:hypothetical protein
MKDVRNMAIEAVKCIIADRESKINILSARLQTEQVEADIACYKSELPSYKRLLHELQTKNAVILTTGYLQLWTDD